MRLIHFYSFSLENVEKYGKIGHFSGRIWPDWGNTAWADMARLGSIGLTSRVMNNEIVQL